MRPVDVKRLSKVTALKVTLAQAKLKQLIDEEARLQDQLRALDHPQSDRNPDTMAGMSTADMRVEARWRIWAGQRKEAIQLELAKLRAQRAEARHILLTVTAKDQAVATILRQAKEAASRLSDKDSR